MKEEESSSKGKKSRSVKHLNNIYDSKIYVAASTLQGFKPVTPLPFIFIGTYYCYYHVITDFT